MILGFNHNITYKGEIFHVQTEDSGLANPHVITLLYRGGVILASKKTSYADIVTMDCLETVVEDLMKEQHKDMMHRLKSGDFDEKAFSIKPQLIRNYEIPTLEPETVSPSSTTEEALQLFDAPLPNRTATPEAPTPKGVGTTENLDDEVLSFFGKTGR